MVIPHATALVKAAGNREDGILKAFEFLNALKLTTHELDFAKSEVVNIADMIYPGPT
jgi:hypothetical protein